MMLVHHCKFHIMICSRPGPAPVGVWRAKGHLAFSLRSACTSTRVVRLQLHDKHQEQEYHHLLSFHSLPTSVAIELGFFQRPDLKFNTTLPQFCRATTTMTPASGDGTFVVDFDTGLPYLVPAAAQPTLSCQSGDLAHKCESSSPLPMGLLLPAKPSPARTATIRAPPPPPPSPPPLGTTRISKSGLAIPDAPSSVTVQCRHSCRHNGRFVQELRSGIRGFLVIVFTMTFFVIAVTTGPTSPLAAWLMLISSVMVWWISSRPMAFSEGVSTDQEQGRWPRDSR